MELTPQQQQALRMMIDFVHDTDKRVFILKGYAGTGKTTLMKELIAQLDREKQPYSLMASTGRAAQILSDTTGRDASTIHHCLYSFRDLNQDLDEANKKDNVEATGQIYLVFDFEPIPEHDGLYIYIVDESSMISDKKQEDISQAVFGSGKLLSDLLDYDSFGKFIFVGDGCQLPPVGQTSSPALSVSYFNDHFNIEAQSIELTDVVRQEEDNDIVDAAFEIREECRQAPELPYELPSGRKKWSFLNWSNYNNIVIEYSIEEMLNQYITLIREKGLKYATMISQSNKKCVELNKYVREALGNSGKLQKNDLLMVTQNNLISGLYNGDMVKVLDVSGDVIVRNHLKFRNVTVENLFDHQEYSQLLLEDALYSPTNQLFPNKQKALYMDFHNRMTDKGIKQNSPKYKDLMREDQFLNALRCSWGYVLTCHKSQGGEWEEVFLIIPGWLMGNATKSSFQWIYTAMTRARRTLHVLNDFFIQ